MLPADREALFVLHTAAMRGYVEATWGPWDDCFQRNYFSALLDRGLAQVVEVGGEIAGFLEVRDSAEQVEVVNIELAPALHSGGLGTQILTGTIATADGRPIALQVLKVNPARHLYERLGFVEIGTTETHFLMRRSASG